MSCHEWLHEQQFAQFHHPRVLAIPVSGQASHSIYRLAGGRRITNGNVVARWTDAGVVDAETAYVRRPKRRMDSRPLAD
jgi:hypothetical protein